MPDLAVVAKAIREADEAHRFTRGSTRAYDCACGCLVRREYLVAHRYDAMAWAAADALGVSLT